MADTAHDSRDSAMLVMSAIAAQVIGGLVAQMSPFVIGGLIDGFALSERDAAFVASVELITLAVTAIAIAPVLPRLSCRRVGVAAVVSTLLAQGASLLSGSWLSFVLLRGLAGIGEGALYAVSLCIVACRSSNPDRLYGYFQIVWAIGSAALFSLGGELTAAFALRGVLALMAAVTLVLAPLVLLVPHTRSASWTTTPTAQALPSPRLAVMMLVSIGLYLTVSAAVYVFSAPLGERAGLDTRAVGYALMVASLLGLAGAGAATALNVRWGRAIPMSGFFAAFALVTLVLCISRDPTAYVVALVASAVIYYFSLPYLFGLAAALDRSGRWAAAAGSAYLGGFAAGPLIAGATIAHTDYAGLGTLAVSVTAVAWLLAMVVNRRLSEGPLPAPAHASPLPSAEV